MVNVIEEASSRLSNLSKGNGIVTGDIRGISSELYKLLEDKSIDNVFTLCEELLDKRERALGVIAYDWAYRVRKQYNEKTFSIFENWLKKYVTGWGDCDDFCTHAFGELLSQNNELFKEVLKWTGDPNFCVRRGAAVVLIPSIKHNKYGRMDPFLISDALMMDEHYLVLKGYGWMLKVLSQTDQGIVYDYLVKNKNIMPRVSFRYALEKFDDKLKAELMRD
jgi:3-methyladenine DNA glycosylase AlkD